MLKSHERLRSDKHNVFTEEVNLVPLGVNIEKRLQSKDAIE